jgi:thymidylate synthase
MNNIDRQYKELLLDIIHFGIDKADRTGTGTKSLFGRQIRHNMKEGFPLLTTKKMAWKSIVTELLWFLRGDTNIKYLLENGCHIWTGDAYKQYRETNEIKRQYDNNGDVADIKEFGELILQDDDFAKEFGELGPIYGAQWRNWLNVPNELNKGGIDQIQNLINQLKTNPDSRRLMVSAWNVGELNQMVLPPCHYGFQVYTRELSFEERKNSSFLYSKLKTQTPILASFIEDILPTNENRWNNLFDELNIPTRAISLMWNQRSVDTFLGLPFNIASYGLLLEIIAVSVNMIPDELIGNLGDVHLYNNHLEQAAEQCSRISYELPKLNINTEFWPTENGSCGEGPLDAVAVFKSFKDENFCKCLLEEDIQLYDYQSHPAIKALLSN